MPILEKQGIRISPSLPSYNTCPTIRSVPFNDLDIVGASAAPLDIKGIKSIRLFHATDPERHVVGIDVVYKLSDGKLSACVLHGARTSNMDTIDIADDERIIGVFLGTNPPSINHIKALRFVKTNVKTGTVYAEPHVSELSESDDSVKYSAMFGNIVAFHGITLRGTPESTAKVLGGMPGRIFSIGFQTRDDV